MSSTSNTPGDAQAPEVSSTPRWVALLFVVAFALVGYLLYAGYTERQTFRQNLDAADNKTQALAAEIDKANSRIADLKGQLDVTSQKLGLTQDELALITDTTQATVSRWENGKLSPSLVEMQLILDAAEKAGKSFDKRLFFEDIPDTEKSGAAA